ncbi:MAG: hypothetical protein QXO86_06645 [Nitrososphaerota archaeon]
MLDLQYSRGLRNETSPILYVFVDEFQDLASEEFANFITEEAMGVELDGATTAKGSLVVKSKPLVHPNVFLSLAQGESIVFGARVTPTAVRHGYVLDRKEKNYVGAPISEIPDHPEHQLPPDHTTAHEVYLRRLLRHGKTKGKERGTTTVPAREPIGCAVSRGED